MRKKFTTSLKENASEKFEFCSPSQDDTKGQTDLKEALGSNWYGFICTAYCKRAKHSYHLLSPSLKNSS